MRPLEKLNSRTVWRFLFVGEFAFLGHAGEAADGDAEEADEDAGEGDAATGGVEDGAEGAVEEGGDEGAEGGAAAEGDGVTEGETEVADGEAEGESADAPRETEEEGPEEGFGGGVGDEGPGFRDEEGGEDRGGDDPAKEAADEPVGFPAPALHGFVGKVETGGGETAGPVKQNAECGVGGHEVSRLRT